MSRINQGFRGIAYINNTDDAEVDAKHFRVSSIDIQKKQEAQQFLPAVGGKGLKRIWFRGTSDTSVTISMPLAEGMAEYFYNLAYNQKEFYIDANYYGRKTRRAIGCKIDNLAFSCNAGEIVQVSITMIAKNVIERSSARTYTKGEKLVTWDKSSVRITANTFPFLEYTRNDIQGFTYNISNGIKTIKTAASLDPNVLTTAIQDVSGQIQFYNYIDLGLPLPGDEAYDLAFREVNFKIDDLSVTHDIVFNPTENIPLSPGPIISVVSWTRSDDFYGDPA